MKWSQTLRKYQKRHQIKNPGGIAYISISTMVHQMSRSCHSENGKFTTRFHIPSNKWRVTSVCTAIFAYMRHADNCEMLWSRFSFYCGQIAHSILTDSKIDSSTTAVEFSKTISHWMVELSINGLLSLENR